MPSAQSDLARELLKDPYDFQFLATAREAEEREIEQGLVAHIREFLLELGAGFAFLGQQFKLEVGGEEFFIDLLFYHVKLRCYVVLELKARPFKPEYAGKMNFYLSAWMTLPIMRTTSLPLGSSSAKRRIRSSQSMPFVTWPSQLAFRATSSSLLSHCRRNCEEAYRAQSSLRQSWRSQKTRESRGRQIPAPCPGF